MQPRRPIQGPRWKSGLRFPDKPPRVEPTQGDVLFGAFFICALIIAAAWFSLLFEAGR